MAQQINQLKKSHPALVFWGIMALVYIPLLCMHLPIKPYSDDIWYASAVNSADNFFTLQSFYYTDWSGRIASSALTFALVGKAFFLWKLLNPAVFIVLCWAIARIAAKTPKLKHFFVVLVLLLLAGPGILDYSVFWATGSMYYLWPAAAAAVLLVPFFDLALRKETCIKYFPLYIILCFFACLGNEQITACVLGFMGVAIADYIIKNKSLPWRFWVLFGVSLAFALVLFLSPGTQSRFVQETAAYAKETGLYFAELSFGTKISNGITWMFSTMVPLLYLTIIILYGASWRRVYTLNPQKTGARVMRAVTLVVFCGALAAVFPTALEPLLSFEPFGGLWQSGFGGVVKTLLPYVFWLVFLCLLAFLLGMQNRYYAISLLAALCTMIALFFSLAIYNSGERTMFAALVILTGAAAGVIKGRVKMPVAVFGVVLAAVNTARLLTRIRLFM